MKFRVLVSLYWFVFGVQTAHAYIATPPAECTPVDFRPEFPLKMRNQNKLSWCFAHAASDYLQFTYKIDEQISAADIAINYSQSRWSTFLKFFRNLVDRDQRLQPAQTGLIKYAVQMILPQGYCPESSLPSDEWTRVDNNGVKSKVEILQATLDLRMLWGEVHAGRISSAHQLPWHYEFKNIPTKQDFFELLRSSAKDNLLLRLRNSACSPDRKPFAFKATNSFKIKNKKAFERINYQLGSEHAPLTVDFFSDVFFHYDNPKRKIGDLHTVLLMARHYDSEIGECTYLLKDSHGDQCNRYDPKIKCEGGYLWLPESKLNHALFSTFILNHR